LGLSLELDAAIDLPGMAAGGAHPPARRPPTLVRLDPGQARDRWEAARRHARRVRELRDGEALLLSVDLAPPAGYLLHAPGFARILVAPDGSELLCDPEPQNPRWSELIGAQALPLAATLRGLEVLHASGVVLPGDLLGGGAALFSGQQGAGKSSLAAALLRRGAALLGDDTIALEPVGSELMTYPGMGVLHLRAEEHERLSPAARAALGPAAPTHGKRRHHPPALASPAPLGGLFLLERSTRGPAVERIEAVDPYALLASTFNLSVRTPERLTRHLDLAASLAASGRVYRLRVQPGVDATQLADALLERLPEL
jgi:hypothetical protein